MRRLRSNKFKPLPLSRERLLLSVVREVVIAGDHSPLLSNCQPNKPLNFLEVFLRCSQFPDVHVSERILLILMRSNLTDKRPHSFGPHVHSYHHLSCRIVEQFFIMLRITLGFVSLLDVPTNSRDHPRESCQDHRPCGAYGSAELPSNNPNL